MGSREGEASVLAWGYANPGTVIIVDDLAARRCGATLGIPVRGTLGLVLTAKKRGMILEARPVLEKLRQSGMYLSNRILRVLALVYKWINRRSQRRSYNRRDFAQYLGHYPISKPRIYRNLYTLSPVK